MAIYSKHQVRLIAATDGTSYKSKIFERDDKTTHEVERSDFQASHGDTVVINNSAHTVTLVNTGLSVIRAIYIKTSGNITVDLLDDTAATNEITGLVLGGAAGTAAAVFYAEIAGFAIAASDTFVLTEPDTEAVTVTYLLLGDDDV